MRADTYAIITHIWLAVWILDQRPSHWWWLAVAVFFTICAIGAAASTSTK